MAEGYGGWSAAPGGWYKKDALPLRSARSGTKAGEGPRLSTDGPLGSFLYHPPASAA